MLLYQAWTKPGAGMEHLSSVYNLYQYLVLYHRKYLQVMIQEKDQVPHMLHLQCQLKSKSNDVAPYQRNFAKPDSVILFLSIDCCQNPAHQLMAHAANVFLGGLC